MNKYEINNISKSFIDGELKRIVLDEVNATFEPGKLYSIMGRSGSGKSTLLNILAGFIETDEGVIAFDGADVTVSKDFFKQKISMVFQNYGLVEYLSAYQNVRVALDIRNVKRDKLDEFIYYILEEVGISKNNANKQVSKLSGGEKQRVGLARALCLDTEIILADEPTGNLDEENEKVVMDWFIRIAREYKKTVIIVTHSDEIAKLCDVNYKIEDRKVISE
ncbi:MAG: ABC transporter ATP-binding protein [Mycoplasmatales bacterium]